MLILLLATLLAATTPTVDELLTRYEAALGDVAAARAHESRVVQWHYEETTGSEADVFEYSLAPDKYLQVMVMQNGPAFSSGANGKSVWHVAPYRTDILAAEDAVAIQRDLMFNRNLRLRELYPELRVAGPATVNGRAAWLVEAVAANGEQEQYYFDAESALLVRHRCEYVLPGGQRMPRDVVYEEYALFGGVRMPTVLRQFEPGPGLFRVTRVEHNADLVEMIFNPPPKCEGAK
jgi:hypothetical protein